MESTSPEPTLSVCILEPTHKAHHGRQLKHIHFSKQSIPLTEQLVRCIYMLIPTDRKYNICPKLNIPPTPDDVEAYRVNRHEWNDDKCASEQSAINMHTNGTHPDITDALAFKNTIILTYSDVKNKQLKHWSGYPNPMRALMGYLLTTPIIQTVLPGLDTLDIKNIYENILEVIHRLTMKEINVYVLYEANAKIYLANVEFVKTRHTILKNCLIQRRQKEAADVAASEIAAVAAKAKEDEKYHLLLMEVLAEFGSGSESDEDESDEDESDEDE